MDYKILRKRFGTYNINITQNNTINSELDIKKVSQELARETERECRRRGLAKAR